QTPGWKRMQAQRSTRSSSSPKTIEGELVARSVDASSAALFSVGEKVLHLKFGEGEVQAVEGNKLTIEFASVGRKKVLESFVQKSA
ncbi:ATP-dependent DNA helicase UvrD/PcrA, partial [hydrothermal vent metagenome]